MAHTTPAARAIWTTMASSMLRSSAHTTESAIAPAIVVADMMIAVHRLLSRWLFPLYFYGVLTMTEPPFDRTRAHRWFAVETNNRAWDLVEKPDRTAEDTEHMIHTAHAALWHWQRAGTEINHLRALCLLATAYIAGDDTRSAARYADQCVALSEKVGDRQTMFDRAAAYGCAAQAHAGEARYYREVADQFAAKLADDDERTTYARLYGRK